MAWFVFGSVWFGLVWFGLVWFGFGLVLVLVWFGLVWFGVVWFGAVRCGAVRLTWFDLVRFRKRDQGFDAGHPSDATYQVYTHRPDHDLQ